MSHSPASSRLWRAAALLLLLLAPSASAAPSPGEGPGDPFGYYFLDSEKPLPAWARALHHLHLSTFDMKGDQMIEVPLYGFIRPRSGDDYRLVSPKQEGAHLTFTTQKVKGVSFDFDGRFLKTGNFPEAPPEGIVLQGKLRRLQEGRVTGEMTASFLYSAGD